MPNQNLIQQSLMPNLKTHCPVFLARIHVHKSYQGQWAILYSRQIIKSITLSSLWLQKTLVVNKEMMHFFKNKIFAQNFVISLTNMHVLGSIYLPVLRNQQKTRGPVGAPLHKRPLHKRPLHKRPLHKAPLHKRPLHELLKFVM